MKLNDLAKAIGGALLAGLAAFEAANGHGTWQHTATATAIAVVGTLVTVYLVPNTKDGKPAALVSLEELAGLHADAAVAKADTGA